MPLRGGRLARALDVDLVADEHLGPQGEIGRMRGELGVDGADRRDRVVLVVAAGEVDHVQDERRALDVAQERVPEA